MEFRNVIDLNKDGKADDAELKVLGNIMIKSLSNLISTCLDLCRASDVMIMMAVPFVPSSWDIMLFMIFRIFPYPIIRIL